MMLSNRLFTDSLFSLALFFKASRISFDGRRKGNTVVVVLPGFLYMVIPPVAQLSPLRMLTFCLIVSLLLLLPKCL